VLGGYPPGTFVEYYGKSNNKKNKSCACVLVLLLSYSSHIHVTSLFHSSCLLSWSRTFHTQIFLAQIEILLAAVASNNEHHPSNTDAETPGIITIQGLTFFTSNRKEKSTLLPDLKTITLARNHFCVILQFFSSIYHVKVKLRDWLRAMHNSEATASLLQLLMM